MQINIHNITKIFNKKTILNDINLNLESGKFYGLLGPNGSGKTTLIKILTKQLHQSSGEVSWVNSDGKKLSQKSINKLIGVVHQNSVLDEDLTVKENLISRGAMYGLNKKQIYKKIGKLDEDFKLKELMKQRYNYLSGGQKRRVDIAKALLNDPEILILDEPTTGIDVKMRSDLWKAIHNTRNKENLTVILVTHYLEEMKNIDYLITLINGENQFFGNPEEFIQKYGYSELKLYFNKTNLTIDNKQTNLDGSVSFYNMYLSKQINILNIAHSTGNLLHFESTKPSLEHSYLQLLQKENIK
ncbi:ABC transporter ATP-binding protein [Staphylococcus shinii]|uniref:ABC transporter ATP-binding protein n=1 Tax=Staphylococcus shinii TaxID=2912228 RepID=UPI003CE6C6ED